MRPQMYRESPLDDYEPTTNEDFHRRKLDWEDVGRFTLETFDIAGRGDVTSLVLTGMPGGFIVMYDITSRASFRTALDMVEKIRSWEASQKTKGSRRCLIALVGNKRDLIKRVIPSEEGRQLAEKFGCGFCEASATKDADHVRIIFAKIIDAMRQSKSTTDVSPVGWGVTLQAVGSSEYRGGGENGERKRSSHLGNLCVGSSCVVL